MASGVSIKTTINKRSLNPVIDIIYKTCRSDPNLSPRPKEELINAYYKGNLLVAFYNSMVAGWLLIIPFNKNCQELAAGYVVDKFRSKGVFGKLIKESLPKARHSIFVTFNYSLVGYSLNKLGFRKSSLREAIKLSYGKFLLNRINIERIKAIRKHYQTAKPVYVIYKND